MNLKSMLTHLKKENNVIRDVLLCVYCTFAGSAVCDGFAHVSVESFFTVMTVSSGRVVSAVHTHSSALTARQFIQLHIEATAPRVQVTVTRCTDT